MRYEVPQFIEVEDKIIGPLTWKQFIYLAGGAGISLILYFMLPFFLFVLIGVPIAALTVFLAFHRINNRPFSIFLESALQYFTGNKLYLWRRGTQQTVSSKVEEETPLTVHEVPLSTYAKYAQGEQNIQSLSRKLELDLNDPNDLDHGEK